MERTDVRNQITVPSGLRLKGIISKEAPEIVQVVCLEDCEIDDIDFEEDYKYYMTPPEAETLIQTGKFHAWNVGRWRIPGKSRDSKLA
jgi:hypothetical protein